MILRFKNFSPKIHPSVFVASSADIIGQVEIGKDSNIWFQVVIRGDVNTIKIGERTNIQDHSCIHVTSKTGPVEIGNEVTVGHRVLIHACKIGNQVLVGMGSTIIDGAEIPDQCIIGANSLITMNKKFPPRTLIMGSPAKVIRDLTANEIAFLKKSADGYVEDAHDYLGQR